MSQYAENTVQSVMPPVSAYLRDNLIQSGTRHGEDTSENVTNFSQNTWDLTTDCFSKSTCLHGKLTDKILYLRKKIRLN